MAWVVHSSFKSFSERVAGSDNTSKLFYTLLYGLYYGINLDYGLILWSQLIQITVSISHNTEISCARFWSIIVKRALVHFKDPAMDDFVVVAISILQTSTFMMSEPSKFSFVGSILEAMLMKVPSDNAIAAHIECSPYVR